MLSKYTFQTGPKELLIALLFIGLFAALGSWQLMRADEKRAIKQDIDSRSHGPGIDLNALETVDIDQMEHQRVRVKGVFQANGLVYIDNQVRDGRAGVYVVTPLQLAGSELRVLVNRGWLAMGNDRGNLPVVNMPAEAVELQGLIKRPSHRPFVPSSTQPLDEQALNLWLYLDLEKYASEANFDILPLVIYQTDGDDDGLNRDWPAFAAKTGMHTGYAIQWFALALIVIGIYLKVSLKKND